MYPSAHLYQPSRAGRGRGSTRRTTSQGTMATTSTIVDPMNAPGAGTLERQQVKWGQLTMMIPKLPPSTANKTLLAAVLKNTVTAVREQGGEGKWSLKTDFLQSRFGYESVKQTAKNKLHLFDNPASQVWTYTMVRTTNSQGAQVQLAQQQVLTDNYREHAWYLELYVTVTPRLAYNECNTLPAMESTNVLLTLPRVNDQVPAAIDRGMITTPILLIQWMQANNHPINFVNRSTNGNISSQEFKRFKEDVYNHSLYEVVAYLLKDLYVGIGVISTPAQRLRSLNRVYVDPSGATHIRSVTDHFQAIVNIAAEMQDENFGLDLCEVAYNTLDHQLQEQITADGYIKPDIAGLTNDQQLDNLRLLRDRAERSQRSIDSIKRIARTAQVSGRNAGPTNAFMASMNPPSFELPPLPAEFHEPPSFYAPEHQAVAYAAMPNPHSFGVGVPFMEDFGETETIVTFLSAAEQALRESSGEVAPLICWGCQTIGHRFMDCPRANGP